MTTQETVFGPLEWKDFYWESQPIATPVFGGAELTIQIFPEGEDKNEPIRAELIVTLQRFFALPPEHAQEIVPHLWAYYCDIRDNVDPPPPVIAGPADVWRHVHPRSVGLQRDEAGVVYLSVEAECSWEEEHGVQLVLQKGDRWVRVSDCSGHITDGRAYASSALDAWIDDPAAKLPVRTIAEMITAPRDGV